MGNKHVLSIKTIKEEHSYNTRHYYKQACHVCKNEWYSAELSYCTQCDKFIKYDHSLEIHLCSCLNKHIKYVKCLVFANDIHNIIINDDDYLQQLRSKEREKEESCLLNESAKIKDKHTCFCSIM